MKINKSIFFILYGAIVMQPNLQSIDTIITFFITELTQKEHPTPVRNQHISQPLQQPSFINALEKNRSWLEERGVDGVSASYLGYFTISDKNGQITFPRRQQSDTIYILITPQVQPQYMLDQTLVAYWITCPEEPAMFYQIKRKQNKALHTYYFETKKLKTPEKIPLNTIIIYTHPENIHVKTGISLNTYSSNFILPNVYAKKFETLENSLYTVSIKQYLEQINRQSKHNEANITTMVINK
jgi:hypothetical protein